MSENLLKIGGRNSCPPTTLIYSFLEIEKSGRRNKINQHPKFLKGYMSRIGFYLFDHGEFQLIPHPDIRIHLRYAGLRV